MKFFFQIFLCTTLGRKQLSAGRNLRLPCMFCTFICCTSDRCPFIIIWQFRAVANAIRPYVSEIRVSNDVEYADSVLWDLRPCSFLQMLGHLDGSCCIHPSSGYPETSAHVYQTTPHHIPKYELHNPQLLARTTHLHILLSWNSSPCYLLSTCPFYDTFLDLPISSSKQYS